MPTLEDLGQLFKKTYPGSYDGIDDLELGRIAKQRHPGEFGAYVGSSTDPAINKQLGNIGGGLGGIAAGALTRGQGGPVPRMIGAGIGGALGEAGNELLSAGGEGLDVQRIANEANRQAALEAAGGVAARGTAMAGEAFFRTAAGKISERAMTRALDAARQFMIPISKTQLGRIGSKIAELRPQAQAILDRIPGNYKIPLGDLTQGISDIMQKTSTLGDDAVARRLHKRVLDLYRQYPKGYVTAAEADAIRRTANDESSKLLGLTKADRARLPLSTRVGEQYHELIGDNVREALRKAPGGEALDAVNQQMTGLQDLRRAINSGRSNELAKRFTAHTAGAAAGAIGAQALPGVQQHRGEAGAAGGLVGGLAASRGPLSALGLILGSPFTQQLLAAQLPRAVAQALAPHQSEQP